MKIAFDCQGTLDGEPSERRTKVHKLFKWFESKGCEMTVWTNGGHGYAQAVVTKFNLNANFKSKTCTWDLDCCDDPMQYYMDVAVDDDVQQTYLAAKNFIWVHEIPDDESLFESTYGYLFNASPANNVKQDKGSATEVS